MSEMVERVIALVVKIDDAGKAWVRLPLPSEVIGTLEGGFSLTGEMRKSVIMNAGYFAGGTNDGEHFEIHSWCHGGPLPTEDTDEAFDLDEYEVERRESLGQLLDSMIDNAVGPLENGQEFRAQATVAIGKLIGTLREKLDLAIAKEAALND